MGSTAKGLISGFICRLCSKMNRYVILIYSKEGERMNLAEKINLYLPITVTRDDPLPKTVCLNCIERLEKHFQMIQTITKAEKKFNNQKKITENFKSATTSKNLKIRKIHYKKNNSDFNKSSIDTDIDYENIKENKNIKNIQNINYYESGSDSD